jgi:hypothetical protein
MYDSTSVESYGLHKIQRRGCPYCHIERGASPDKAENHSLNDSGGAFAKSSEGRCTLRKTNFPLIQRGIGAGYLGYGNVACCRWTMKRSTVSDPHPDEERPKKQARPAVDASQLLSPSPTTVTLPVSKIRDSNSTNDEVNNDTSARSPGNSRDVVCFGMVSTLTI